MSEETPQEPPKPICGWCKADPGQLSTRDYLVGPLHLLVIYCASCRAIISSHLLEIAQPRVAVPNPGQIIVPR